MPNPLFNQLQNNAPMSPLLRQFLQFKKTFNGDPQQMIQEMLNSGRITQAQMNQYAQQANQLYEQFKQFM